MTYLPGTFTISAWHDPTLSTPLQRVILSVIQANISPCTLAELLDAQGGDISGLSVTCLKVIMNEKSLIAFFKMKS